MTEPLPERERRVAQFAAIIFAIQQDAMEPENEEGCFLTINETPRDDSGDPHLDESRDKALPVVAEMCIGAACTPPGGDPVTAAGASGWFQGGDEPSCGRGGDSGPGRFVQFAFRASGRFFMDLPKVTLRPVEAGRLFRERSGFFYMKDRAASETYSSRVAEAFDPVCKVYLAGDERCAAEDAAWIFFDLWNFPTDWRFFVTSGSWGPCAATEVDRRLG